MVSECHTMVPGALGIGVSLKSRLRLLREAIITHLLPLTDLQCADSTTQTCITPIAEESIKAACEFSYECKSQGNAPCHSEGEESRYIACGCLKKSSRQS
jgi:hypothetical protein